LKELFGQTIVLSFSDSCRPVQNRWYRADGT
jgi:hypothetical protein